MLWLAIDLPTLALAVHTRAQRNEELRPLAVVQEGRVLAANAEALAAGVMAGQATASALALCPRLRFLEQLPLEEARLLRQMAEACFVLTPTVVLAAPRGFLLEVGGCLQLFKGLPGLLRQLHKRLRPYAVTYTVAQAPTPKAALLLAQGGLGDASLLQPAGAGCLPLLRQVSTSLLPWEPEPMGKLRRLHLKTLGELFELPRPALSKRLGAAATHYLAAMLGEVPDPQQGLQPAEDFQHSLYFLDGVSHSEGLRFPMRRLLEDFCRFLRQRQWTCARFHWRFSHQDRSRQQLLIASARGEPEVARLLRLSELKLEHFQITAPVASITLVATEFQSLGDSRLSLLPEPGQENAQAIELLDRLRARLGTAACRRLSPQNSLRPEQEQRLGEEFVTVPAVAPTTALRPAWVWPEARPLQMLEGRLWWQGGFSLLSGPERIELPWWEDGDRRDYWLARHDNGGHYWLYFSTHAQSWFCQGLFG